MIGMWEVLEDPPRMLSIIVAGGKVGMVELGKMGMRPRIERSWDLYCDIVGQASIV